MKVENFSVFKEATRTTSAIEAYNGVLGRMIAKTGNFFKFVKVLQSEEFSKHRDFQLLIESGGTFSQKRRKNSDTEKAKKILEASLLLESASITALTFINRMAFPKNVICAKVEPMDDIFQEYGEEQEYDEETDEEKLDFEEVVPAQNDNTCIICLKLAANIVMLPCKHTTICSECLIRLQAQALSKNQDFVKCPICREKVQDSIQIYNK